MTTTPIHTLPQMRLRGDNPCIEVSASNLSFVLGEAATGGPAAVTLRQGATPATSTAFLHVLEQRAPGQTTTLLCATDRTGDPSLLWSTPALSIRTWADAEEARIDGAGTHLRTLTADAYTNLVGDYQSANAQLPPSAAALGDAYVSLSNMIVTAKAAGGFYSSSSSNGGGSSSSFGPLVDSYTSTAVLNAPTANALRAAYYNLSNMFVINYRSLQATVPTLVRTATVSLVGSLSLGSNAGTGGTGTGGGTTIVMPSGPQFALSNDAYLLSTPDNQPRAFYATNGPTVSVAPGLGSAAAFSWFSSGLSTDIMSMNAQGDLWVRGGAAIGGAVAAAGTCALGSNLSVVGAASFGSNVAVAAALDVAGPGRFAAGVAVGGALGVAGPATFAADATVAGAVSASSVCIGSNVLSHAGSNVGLNLPPGVAPVATFHVNGTMFSSEQFFALSDESVKCDVQPISRAAAKVMRIRGCSYLRTDLGPEGRTKRQVGVIAQAVHSVLPEAVQIGADGRMSVAYGNLVALTIEAIRDLSMQQKRLARRLDRMELLCRVRRRAAASSAAGRPCHRNRNRCKAESDSDWSECGSACDFAEEPPGVQ